MTRTPRCGQGAGREVGDGFGLNIRACTGPCSPAAGHSSQQQQLQLLLRAGSLAREQQQEAAAPLETAAGATLATQPAAGWDAAGAAHGAGDGSLYFGQQQQSLAEQESSAGPLSKHMDFLLGTAHQPASYPGTDSSSGDSAVTAVGEAQQHVLVIAAGVGRNGCRRASVWLPAALCLSAGMRFAVLAAGQLSTASVCAWPCSVV
jgi:hypothetical protein